MIKFDVLNRFTGKLKFSAEIDCSEDAPRRLKLGLAVQWGRKNGADLSGANLSGADLYGANLYGANLFGANLYGAKWRDGIVIHRAPLFVGGLAYRVIILDQHIQIGCELHAVAEWEAFDDRRIAAMDGVRAARFWTAHKAALIALAKGDGRGVEKAEEQAA